jgi:CO/xanthine dehydrogenase Mo-binding subunit
MEREACKTVGKVARRKDGLAKVTGVEVYASDAELPYMFHARVLRSPRPHARIVSIDTTEAEKIGAACLTPDDVPDIRFNERQVSVPVKTFRDRTVLPRVVRQVGDGVVAVAARTEALAERALRAVKVEWEVLPPVSDVHEAMADDAPQLYNNRAILGIDRRDERLPECSAELRFRAALLLQGRREKLRKQPDQSSRQAVTSARRGIERPGTDQHPDPQVTR